jgi:hypothetical protein
MKMIKGIISINSNSYMKKENKILIIIKQIIELKYNGLKYYKDELRIYLK